MFDIAANWKLWYDNGVECYHCPTMHGESFAAAFDVSPERNVPVLTDHLMNSRFVSAAARDGHTLRSNRFCSFQSFPGCQLIQHDDLLVLGRIVPTGRSRAASSCTTSWSGMPTRAGWRHGSSCGIAPTTRTPTRSNGQQKGLCSGRVPRLRYVPAREKPALFINALIREAYRGALGEYGGAPTTGSLTQVLRINEPGHPKVDLHRRSAPPGPDARSPISTSPD